MESQVEKLYKNAGIKPYIYCSKPRLDCNAREKGNCKQDCEYYSGEKLLISFTAEKQIELIKWLSKFNLCIEQPDYAKGYYFIETHTEVYSEFLPIFEETLAGLVNQLWQDLTEEEKEQIRGILNG